MENQARINSGGENEATLICDTADKLIDKRRSARNLVALLVYDWR